MTLRFLSETTNVDQAAVEIPSRELMTICGRFSIFLNFSIALSSLCILIVLFLVLSPHTPLLRGLPSALLALCTNQANPG